MKKEGKKMKISVLGCGRWGSFIAWYLCNKGTTSARGGRRETIRTKCCARRAKTNTSRWTSASPDLRPRGGRYPRRDHRYLHFFAGASRVCGAYPRLRRFGKGFRAVYEGHRGRHGRQAFSGARRGGISPEHIAVWVGPGHIQAFTQGIPNCMVIDSASKR